jgi:predicted lipid-binding transport protein (Tim44 family)
MSIHEHFVGPMGGVVMSCIAFSIVFLVICGLMLVMFATKMLARALDVSAREKAAAPKAGGASGAPVRAVAAPPAPAAVPASAAGEGDELIAVLTAAVCCALGRPARVTAFRSLAAPARGFASCWRTAGRLESLEGHEA